MGFFVSTSMEVVIGLILIVWVIYRYFTRNYDFWERRGVPYSKPVFPFGSMTDLTLGRTQMGKAYDAVYKQFPKERFFGALELQSPVLVIRDPNLIKHILLKDFNYFVDRAAVDINPREGISNHLFMLNGESWKKMRQRLTPAFSSGKMKSMFLLMLKCSEQLQECLVKITEKSTIINVKDISSRFTMDVIATCAFGLEINSLINDQTEFFQTGINIFRTNLKLLLRQRFISLFPYLAEVLNIQRTSPEIKNMLYSMVSNTVKYREENNIKRKDFLDILIRLKHNQSILDEDEREQESEPAFSAKENEGITLDQMVAQSFVFFGAGFETASSTTAFCLYELAQNLDIQERLWQEVDKVLQNHGDQITYQALQEMIYMDQVINETLRMYPSLPVLHRRCTQTYSIPNSDLVLEKGQKIRIPVLGIHHDPQYYPEPYQFDPDRFTPENIKTRHPYVHLPFGTGPRNCIGMRFGMMQTKIGLTVFISKFRVEVTPETTIPVPLLKTAFVAQPEKPVLLKVTKR